MDNIEGEWSAFNEIMRRKDSSIQTQVYDSALTLAFSYSRSVETFSQVFNLFSCSILFPISFLLTYRNYMFLGLIRPLTNL